MEKGDLTYQINGCAMKVHTQLGRGFMEYIYCRALAIELRKVGIAYEREVWLPIHYDQLIIGHRRCDFICAESIIVEVKAKSELNAEHMAQAINTVERLNYKNGLLINFGSEKLQFKHIFNKKYDKAARYTPITPEMVGETNDDLFESRQYLPAWLIEKMQKDKRSKK